MPFRTDHLLSRINLRKKLLHWVTLRSVRRKGGCHIEPEDWNDLVEDPDHQAVDYINDYEVASDLLKEPKTLRPDFRQWPEFVEQT